MNQIFIWAFCSLSISSFSFAQLMGKGFCWVLIDCTSITSVLLLESGTWRLMYFFMAYVLLHGTRSLLMEEVGIIISICHTKSAPLNVFVQPESRKLLFRSKDASDWNSVVSLALDFRKEFANSKMFWLHCLVWGLKLSWKCLC